MGYVAVKGGTGAIEASIRRLTYERLKEGVVLEVDRIRAGLRGLVDQVMSESSLYSETIAALCIKQAEGNPEEAVFTMRAFRSTLPRIHYSMVVESESMRVERRVSATFKDIPGGQILGASYDYVHRLIDFSLTEEKDEDAREWIREWGAAAGGSTAAGGAAAAGAAPGAMDAWATGPAAAGAPRPGTFAGHDDTEAGRAEVNGHELPIGELPKVLDYLRGKGLMRPVEPDDSPPLDVTKESLTFPTRRSQRLQVLTRGETGTVTALGYASLRGYGPLLHPTVGELRVGVLPVTVPNPFGGEDPEDAYYVGGVKVTEVESVVPVGVPKGEGRTEIEFDIGYGICFGQNETKAIAMSLLDQCLEHPDPAHPTHDEEFVLLHIDSVEATGFISHLKLPHYVTFQSELDSVRASRRSSQSSLADREVSVPQHRRGE
jgi:alpha-D-ribose 1-methylphosphonate 5-triphosphate synthase subunit PhnI